MHLTKTLMQYCLQRRCCTACGYLTIGRSVHDQCKVTEVAYRVPYMRLIHAAIVVHKQLPVCFTSTVLMKYSDQGFVVTTV